MSSTDFLECVLCATIKDENLYIKNWVEYYLNLGFDKIYLYDDKSKEPYDDLLKKFIEEKKVKIIPWYEEFGNNPLRIKKQLSAYKDAVKSFRNPFKMQYFAFFDADEYLDIGDFKSVKEMIMAYDCPCGFSFLWKVFNANGRIKQPDYSKISIFDAYTNVVEYYDPKTKPMVRPELIDQFGNVHTIYLKDGCKTICLTNNSNICDSRFVF